MHCDPNSVCNDESFFTPPIFHYEEAMTVQYLKPLYILPKKRQHDCVELLTSEKEFLLTKDEINPASVTDQN